MNALAPAFGVPNGPMPLFAILLTVGAYLCGVWVHRRTQWALANPVLIAIVLIGLTLHLLHISYATYFAGAQMLHFLLGPATVALAVPLARAMPSIRANLWPMLAALLAGSISSMVAGYSLVRLLGGSQVLALSMLPKSLTSPIALEVSATVGGVPSLTVVFAIMSGITVAVVVTGTSRSIRVDDPSAVGFAAGLAGGGIGASRVIGRHPLSTAFAAVGIALNGMVTAMLAPVMAWLLRSW